MTTLGSAARSRRASARCATKNVSQPAAASAMATGSSPQPYASALTTAAQSAGAAWLPSVRQFATMAPQSMVSVAPASSSGVVGAEWICGATGNGSAVRARGGGAASATARGGGSMATTTSGVLAGLGLCGLTLRLLNNIELRPLHWG